MGIHSRPLYFQSGDRTLFGWLGTADANPGCDVGVVLCKPFGYEAICTHEALRAFGDACVASGAHALRFDYSGTGDSGDPAEGTNEIDQWCADIGAAIDALRTTCAVRRIYLAGIRLGALLAAQVACRRPVDGLIAIAPVTSGRRYVRELLAFRAAAPLAGATAPGTADAADRSSWLEVTGFRLSTPAVDTLRRIDLAEGSRSQAGAALILDREEFPEAKRWSEKMQAEGTDTSHMALGGYPGMSTTPHAAVPPAAMIEALRAWLTPRAHMGGQATTAPTLPAAARALLRSGSGVELVEQASFLDEERILFAVITERADRSGDPAGGARGIVLINGGATVHIGPNRMYVDMGRAWAAKGYVVLRLDIAGLGDSETRPGEPRNLVYPPGAVDDVGVAVEFMRRHCGVAHVTVAGLCAGAYHAIRAAITGLPVDRALMINPLTFYWRQGDTLSDLQLDEVMRNPGRYAENIRSARHWAKLLRGDVNLWRVARVFVGRFVLAIKSALQDLLRERGIRLPHDLGWDLALVARRGIPMVFYFARGDTGLDLLRNQAGSMLGKLGDRCRVHVIEGGDHIFSQFDARAELAALLDSELSG